MAGSFQKFSIKKGSFCQRLNRNLEWAFYKNLPDDFSEAFQAYLYVYWLSNKVRMIEVKKKLVIGPGTVKKLRIFGKRYSKNKNNNFWVLPVKKIHTRSRL